MAQTERGGERERKKGGWSDIDHYLLLKTCARRYGRKGGGGTV